MRSTDLACLLAVAISLSTAARAADEPVSVRHALPPGKYLMTTTSRSEGTTTIDGAKTPTKDQSAFVWQLDVPKPDDNDEKKVTARLIEAKTEGEESGEPFSYDSSAQGEQKEDLAFIFRALMKTTLVVTLDADDSVIEAAGLDKLWASLAEEAQTDAQKAVVASMKISMNDKLFEANFRRLESLMPKKEVAVGDAWKSGLRLELPLVGEIKAKYDCKLAALDKDASGEVAVIEATSSYSLSSPKTSQIEGVNLTLNKIEMEEKATLKVQLKTGLVVLDESRRSAKAEAKATQNGEDHEVSSQTVTTTSTTFALGAKPAPKTPPADDRASLDDKPDAQPDGKTPERRQADSSRGTRKPLTIALRRQWEPRQKAFSILVPEGWILEGGMFAVDPMQAGGPLNSIDTKCDLSIKRDAAGTVMARWAPAYNYVEFPPDGEYASLAAMFPPGRVYKGALCKSLPSVEEFLNEGFKSVRPEATDVRIVQRAAVPELVDILNTLSRDSNAATAALGKAPMTFTAGAVVFEYREDGAKYREGAFTAIYDLRAAAGMWGNQFTFHTRAPIDEADAWKPVMDVVRQSIQFNPEWLAAYQKAVGDRNRNAAETMRYLARIDQEIVEHRAKTHAEIRHEDYLWLTGQEEYVNPYTRETEQDTSAYKYRWANAHGDRLYSDQRDFDPNRDRTYNNVEWKLTPARER